MNIAISSLSGPIPSHPPVRCEDVADMINIERANHQKLKKIQAKNISFFRKTKIKHSGINAREKEKIDVPKSVK